SMKRFIHGLIAFATLAGLAIYGGSRAVEASGEAAPIYAVKLPEGYRDWKLISVGHEEGKLNDLRAILGNDIAVKAARDGTLPFPDGSIIARLAWSYDPLAESKEAFGQAQSFVAGPPKNGVQFMVKIPRNTPPPAAGDLRSSTTASPPPKRFTAPASPATILSRRATLSSTAMHPEAAVRSAAAAPISVLIWRSQCTTTRAHGTRW